MTKKTTRNYMNGVKQLKTSKPIPVSNPNDVLERDVQVPDSTIVTPEEANKKTVHFSFFSRVLSIPLIRDTSNVIQHYANQNSVGRFALTRAESTLNYAVAVASPYTEKLKPQLLKVDQLGCQSLDVVQHKFPVVTQESDQIIRSVKESQVFQTVSNATSLSVPNSIHQLVDKYLPPPMKDEQEFIKEKSVDERQKDVKLFTFANQVKDRLTYRVTTGLQSLPHSKADISRLAETNQLLHETFQSIQKANGRLNDFILSLKGYKDTTQTKANQRIQELTTDLIHRLDAAASYVKDRQVMNNLPHSVHIVIDPLVTFATNEYEIVRQEVLKPDVAPLQKATNILHMTQDYVLPLIQKSIQGVEQQVRQYSPFTTNSRVIQDVKSTFGFVKVKA